MAVAGRVVCVEMLAVALLAVSDEADIADSL